MSSKHPQVNLKRWREHVCAARACGQSLAAYAREQGLSAHTLYAARGLMRARGELPARAIESAEPSVAAFVPISIVAGITMTAHLANGVRVSCELTDAAALQTMLSELARLPCSG